MEALKLCKGSKTQTISIQSSIYSGFLIQKFRKLDLKEKWEEAKIFFLSDQVHQLERGNLPDLRGHNS